MTRVLPAACVLITIVTCGCTSVVRLYPGEARPKNEVATIAPWYADDPWIRSSGATVATAVIEEVSGRKLEGKTATVLAEVLPGQHSVTVTALFLRRQATPHGTMTEGSHEKRVLMVQLKEGRAYQAKSSVDSTATDKKSVRIWIEDAKSGEVVAGSKTQ